MNTLPEVSEHRQARICTFTPCPFFCTEGTTLHTGSAPAFGQSVSEFCPPGTHSLCYGVYSGPDRHSGGSSSGHLTRWLTPLHLHRVFLCSHLISKD